MQTLKRLLMLVSGLYIISLAINLIIASNIGATPWDTATFTTAKITDQTPGFWLFTYGILLTIAINIINKNKFNKTTILNMLGTIFIGFILGMFVNINNIIINTAPSWPILGIIGLALFAIGIILCKYSNMPADPITNFMIGLTKFKNIQIFHARILVDLIALAITVSLTIINFGINNLFSYYLGIGTLISFVLLPLFIALFDKLFTSIFKK